MIKAALLGGDIGYTKSPLIHEKISRVMNVEMSFDVADVAEDGLENAVKRLLSDYDGFFITKPYKNAVKKYLSRVETKCGVNFVKCDAARGYNTDGAGFIYALDRAFPDWRKDVNAVLVLGAGGAAYSVTEALIGAGKKVYSLNRTVMHAARLCTALGAKMYTNQPAELIVNCTSLGLHGEDALHALCVIPDFMYAYDLIYCPPETPFLHRCGAAGAKTANGRDMLIYQAILGDSILFDAEADVNGVFEKVNTLLSGEF